ncbi:hypothetical protein B0J11DRAFT_517263 [Dendryphion nanum]|uniref:Mmc1 C-terminal domain-containing protein n=1 Tax=Dendryphion nanum TaxID=256645 RepID=A0A9P9EBT1_9PLEO|nr:hypothetical protein B0J11DRAFT_517263 [Dendryphion nanum]
MPPWAAISPRICTASVTRCPIDRFAPRFSAWCRSNGAAMGKHGGTRWKSESRVDRTKSVIPRDLYGPLATTKYTMMTTGNLRSRCLSTQISVSPSIVNARPSIAPRNRELYKELVGLNNSPAERFVNHSRLDLALRGLEGSGDDTVTRVAILGLNGQQSAGRLARLLLADPLAEKGAWEDILEQGGKEPVLLKFGDEADSGPENPLYKTMFVPSRVLHKYKVEILVSTLNLDTSAIPVAATLDSSQDAVLVPKLQARAASGVPVPFPVHKTLVLGEGADGAVAFGRFTADGLDTTGELVRVAIELPPPAEEMEPKEHSLTTTINIKTAADALTTFRKSIANSSKYEHGWFRSGLPTLSHWLVHDLEPSESIKPIVKTLVTSIANDIETNIAKEDAEQLAKLAASSTTPQISDSMVSHLETWAEKSHTELRDDLDVAFSTRNWHKISWWKLFWRVDDVGMIASEIIERRWLVSAEKNSVFLAGRMNQAGFPETIAYDTQPISEIAPSDTTAARTDPSPLPLSHDLSLSTTIHTPLPWPSTIPTTRLILLQTTIPPLQALAQRLVLTTLSTTSLSSALATLLYVSSSSTSAFEAGAIAALGFVFSLRHTQKMWEGARTVWERRVREEGRTALKTTEEGARAVVEEVKRRGGVGAEGVDGAGEDGAVERKEGRKRVDRIRELLGQL